MPQVAPSKEGLKTVLNLWFFISLCPAPGIDAADGQKRADCLSPPTAGEFPRAPAAATTRRIKRDTAFSFHVKENEGTIPKTTPRIGKISQGPPPEV